MTTLTTAQCSARVHTFYASVDDAQAIARARSRDGAYYVARKCTACSGWRLKRIS